MLHDECQAYAPVVSPPLTERQMMALQKGRAMAFDVLVQLKPGAPK